MKSGGNLRTI